jgi:hypothetical protein
VRELCLFASADLQFWKKYLHPTGLHPTNADGKAQLLISAIAAKFKGLAFRELSICIAICRDEDGPNQDGFYLAQAFNSRRFFAFIERTMFHTPYHHARIELSADPPARMLLTKNQTSPLKAEMSPQSRTLRTPSITEEFSWEGPIFLPQHKTTDRNRLFYARLTGPRQLCPFLPSQDVFSLAPSPDHAIFQSLVDSNITPTHWTLRTSATHAKSKTISRDSPGFSAIAPT